MIVRQRIENTIWSALALVPVAIVSLGYIFFQNDFAKIYLNLSFLDFPIFIGEILLAWCVLLLICRWLIYRPKYGSPYFFILIYPAWLLFKTVQGYMIWGPLALRHAALFYYPLFFMVGFVSFNRDIFSRNALLLFFTLIFMILAWGHESPYWTVTLSCLGFILILAIKDRKWSIFMALALIAVIPYVYLFKTARMMFAGNIASLLLIMVGLFYFIESKIILKMIILVSVVLGASFGFYKFFVLGESGRTFPSPVQIVDVFKKVDEGIRKKMKTITIQSSPTVIVHRQIELFHQQKKVKRILLAKSISFNYECIKKMNFSNDSPKTCPAVSLVGVENESIGNILFRLFIWRDMFEDWKIQKPIMGIDFGKPFLSPSLVSLHWAESEWQRDGWIELHNSYFDILYRAGIVGIFLVILLWGALAWLIRLAFVQRSWILILLAAIFLNWMVAANFLSILEFPYTAIPFWSLAGMAGAYAIKKDQVK